MAKISLDGLPLFKSSVAEITRRPKIRWSEFDKYEIEEKYAKPLSAVLDNLDLDAGSTSLTQALIDTISKISFGLLSKTNTCKKFKAGKIYVKLPLTIKSAKSKLNDLYRVWADNNFAVDDESHVMYILQRSIYRNELRKFLRDTEMENIKKLHFAADSNEKEFWKLVKGQRSSSQMTAFQIDGAMCNDKDKIRDTWADHFEFLGTPSQSDSYDSNFFNRVTDCVKEIFEICISDINGVLSATLSYDEVASVCASLPLDKSGILLSYEHIRFGGPSLWKVLHKLFTKFFADMEVPTLLKTTLILPLFKGKGLKAYLKDNYRGITMFPTLCKIYEIMLLKRIEKFASERNYFSDLQFGFKEGVGCTEASFTILETINHIIERGGKVFACYLDVKKAFDTVWIDGLLFKLFFDLGIDGKFWLILKDLYTDIHGKVLYGGNYSRTFKLLQGSGQGRILAPFMYKVYINGLLKELSNHCLAISINQLKLNPPTFADDITLLALHPSFLQALMKICYNYSLLWRYDFNNSKSGVVVYGEAKSVHFNEMKERSWLLGDNTVNELYEYQNLGVFKNYCGSFSTNVDENIKKATTKAGMIFSANFDRRKTNPFVYIKFWKQVCLPSLLFGVELFSLNKSLLEKLERCQRWFLKILFYVPDFCASSFLLQIAGLSSVEAEIDLRKLLFLGRVINNIETPLVIRDLFTLRMESLRDPEIHSVGVITSLYVVVQKYELTHVIDEWFESGTFPLPGVWKKLIKRKIRAAESEKWHMFCAGHPKFGLAGAAFTHISSYQYWSLTSDYPDLVKHFHLQMRIMGNFGLNGGVPWLEGTNGCVCYICLEGVEDNLHFLLDCSFLREHFSLLWSKLQQKILKLDLVDGPGIVSFLNNLDRASKALFLLGGLLLPFQKQMCIMIRKFVSVAVYKIYQLRLAKLREMEAP